MDVRPPEDLRGRRTTTDHTATTLRRRASRARTSRSTQRAPSTPRRPTATRDFAFEGRELTWFWKLTLLVLISLVSLVLFLWTGLVACSYITDESPNGLCRQPSWTNHTICKPMVAQVHPYFEAILKEDELVAKYYLDVAERAYVPDKIKDLYQEVSKTAIHVISSDRSKHDKGRKLLQSLNVQIPATADDMKENDILLGDLAKGLADTSESWGSWTIKGFKVAARHGLNRTDRPLALFGSSFGLPLSALDKMIHRDTMSYVDLVLKDIDGVIESYDQTSRGLTEMQATLRRLAVLFAGTSMTPSLAPHMTSLVLLESNSHQAYWNAALAPSRRMLPEFDAAVAKLASFSEQVFNTTNITNEELAGWQRMRKRIGCQLRKRGWVKRGPPRNWTPTAGSCKLTASKWRESMAYMQQQRENAEARKEVVWAESFELSRLQQMQAIHEEYYREQKKKKQKRWF